MPALVLSREEALAFSTAVAFAAELAPPPAQAQLLGLVRGLEVAFQFGGPCVALYMDVATRRMLAAAAREIFFDDDCWARAAKSAAADVAADPAVLERHANEARAALARVVVKLEREAPEVARA